MAQEVDETVALDAGAITERVRERYAEAARSVRAGAGCCGTAEAFGADLSNGNYTAEDIAAIPEEAALASLGCGNPTALIDLREGETVLDLGSGGGIDVLLSAKRVGSTGFAYGLDMTDEMLALAQENKAKAGVTNVAFLKGRSRIFRCRPTAVDVVISNCVINLSSDKGKVLREAFRVLRPGGRFAVSDVIADGPVPSSPAQEYGGVGRLSRWRIGNLRVRADACGGWLRRGQHGDHEALHGRGGGARCLDAA